MTKADIVNEIAKATDVDREIVVEMVEKFMEVVKDSLSHGEPVYLRGFGSFIIKTRKAKIARNISAGEPLPLPEHNIPAFKPSKSLAKIIK